ncbi:oxygen-dependent protoporphyrinogen oxidase [Aspergillus wentii]|nr:oxygen-dependent protoporphyrinogen oxidase [Aspergillus wentii]
MRLPWAHSRALKAVRTPLVLSRHGQRRAQHTQPYDAAVIGGGITGLTTAFRLSQDPSCAQVTLYEKSSRIGGWINSETIPVDDGKVVFEYGPRTLRAALVDLDLHDEILLTSKKSPAASNRYIYYPDHLVRMPAPSPDAGFVTNALSIFNSIKNEPVFESLIRSVILEPMKVPSDETIYNRDESVADFVSRRFSPQIADNLVSALYHGIYAGDIDRMSAQTLMGSYRDFESHDRRVLGSLLHSLTSDLKIILMDDLLALHSVAEEKRGSYWKSLKTLVNGASVLTMKNGVGQLTDGLAAALNKSDKVNVITETEVKAIDQDPNTSDLTISYGDNQSQTHNRVVATNSAPDLANKLGHNLRNNQQVPHRTIKNLQDHNYAVTVMVINLYYPNPDLVPVKGFGYLIPRSIPFEQNPERALGVIFASDSSVGQDTAPGTKLTVMMGGHWWDDWKESDYPDHDTAVSMCQSLLERHLGITDQPTIARSRLQRNAIPQYTVGHLDRMNELSRNVRHEFMNRLTLAGSWYGGIGVADCIRQGYLAASFGVGAQKLDAAESDRPWRRYSWEDWELEGGIVTSPVRWVEAFRTERKHIY